MAVMAKQACTVFDFFFCSSPGILRDRAWRDAQASSNRDQGNTARKKREATA